LLGLADKLQKQGVEIIYSKPLGNYYGDESLEEADVNLVQEYLHLSAHQFFPPLVKLSESAGQLRLDGQDTTDYQQLLRQQLQSFDRLICIEGGSTLWEGKTYHLSTKEISDTAEADVLIVMHYHSWQSIDQILSARAELGERLLGVVINDVSVDRLDMVNSSVVPALIEQGIQVFGVLPRNQILHGVSVRELVKQLNAEILCRPDRLDLLVQSLSIGAMNCNSAFEYFRLTENKAVVTGGDREDIQIAALETSTNCLILTGHLKPRPWVVSRADILEIPILCVDLDTLTTVEIIERCFKRARIQEPVKVEIIRQLVAEHFDFNLFDQWLAKTS
jgi:BioD-like phosphotransacetylase family protein